MLAKLFSWWHGRKIGELRYRFNLFIGDLEHCLPPEMWTDEQKSRYRKLYDEVKWTGFRWEYTGRQLTHSMTRETRIYERGEEPQYGEIPTPTNSNKRI